MCVLISERRSFMKHKLKNIVSNNSSKKRVDTYKKVSHEIKVKRLIGELDKIIIIVPGDSAKYRRV